MINNIIIDYWFKYLHLIFLKGHTRTISLILFTEELKEESKSSEKNSFSFHISVLINLPELSLDKLEFQLHQIHIHAFYTVICRS